MRFLVAVLATLGSASGFYLPGVSPHSFGDGEPIKLFVNSLTSVKTHLPFDYYKLGYCRPESIKSAPENLGQLLMGNDIENSPFEIEMNVNKECQVLCTRELNAGDRVNFVDMINDEYVVNWIVDNLPAAAEVHIPDSDLAYKVYEHGFAVGGVEVGAADAESHFIHNHYNIKIMFHKSPNFEGKRVVGFEVEPLSVDHGDAAAADATSLSPDHCDRSSILDGALAPMYVSGPSASVGEDGTVRVTFTYSVEFAESATEWASRWDVYLSMNNRYAADVHWFSIVNSVTIVLFLTGMVALIMLRTVYKDVRRYNRVPTEEDLEEEREEKGWKLVHADVFRPPRAFPMLLAAATGTGTQLGVMGALVILFSAAGFVSPANRGSLMIALLLLFVLMGAVAGYVSARVYNFFLGKMWQRCTVLTAFGFPGFAFGVFFLLNLFVWSEGSSGAVPFGSMTAIMLLWFGISTPLVFLGAYYGYRRDRIEAPTKTSAIPRQIPPQPWFLTGPSTVLIGGVLPFSAVFVELYFVLSSLWLDQYYYVFGFLALVFVILAITCVEIAIVLTYFQLCSEDYRWAWRSFVTPGSSAVYLFGYSIFYFASKLDVTAFVPSLVYFGYMFLISVGFFLLTGSIGFLSSLWFTRKIFGSIKVE